MGRLVRLFGHGFGVAGAALGIESLAAAAIPGLVRFLPFGMRLLQLRTGGVLGGTLFLLGAVLIACTKQ